MKELKCEYGECKSTLSSLPEVATGICDKHRDFLDRRHHYAVVCWNCSSLILIDEAPVQGGIKLIRDKYIFAKTCKQCTPGSKGEEWMNNPSREELSNVVLGDKQTLNFKQGTLYAGPKKAIPIHRRVVPTVDPDKGEDIITKIEIKAEADKRLETFLDNLEIEGNDDGE